MSIPGSEEWPYAVQTDDGYVPGDDPGTIRIFSTRSAAIVCAAAIDPDFVLARIVPASWPEYNAQGMPKGWKP